MENIEMNNIELEETEGTVEAVVQACEEVKKSNSGIGLVIFGLVGTAVAGALVITKLRGTKEERELKRMNRYSEYLRERGWDTIPPEEELEEINEEDVYEIEN